MRARGSHTALTLAALGALAAPARAQQPRRAPRAAGVQIQRQYDERSPPVPSSGVRRGPGALIVHEYDDTPGATVRAPPLVHDFDDRPAALPEVVVLPPVVHDYDDRPHTPDPDAGPHLVEQYDDVADRAHPSRPRRSRLRALTEYEGAASAPVLIVNQGPVDLPPVAIAPGAPPSTMESVAPPQPRAETDPPRRRRARRAVAGFVVSVLPSARLFTLVAVSGATRGVLTRDRAILPLGAVIELGYQSGRATYWGAYVGAYGVDMPYGPAVALARIGVSAHQYFGRGALRAGAREQLGLAWLFAPADTASLEVGVGLEAALRVDRRVELIVALDVGLGLLGEHASMLVPVDRAPSERVSYTFGLLRAGLELGVRFRP